MFFKLIEISDHPCCKMQDVVEHFFSTSIDERMFSPKLFPEWFRSTLTSTNCTLSVDFEEVHRLLHQKGVSIARRRSICEAALISNAIEKICDGGYVFSEDVIDWYGPLGAAIESLIERLYDSMDLAVFRRGAGAVKPRMQLYQEFIRENKYVCPFCSIGKYKNKLGQAREGFDHYLNRASYPLSAANMNNLVPTCGTCNEDYKKAKDILADGAAFYPYAPLPEVEVKVKCLTYPATDLLDDRGRWDVEVRLSRPDPKQNAKMKAWDRVYCVRDRLKNEVAEFFEEWMKEVAWDVNTNLDETALRAVIRRARDRAREASLRHMEPNQIIRAAFFDFMVTGAEKSFLLSFRDLFNGQINS